MTALVSVETVLLVLLIVLVAGLLRSHAELLRRIGPPGQAERPPPTPHRAAGQRAPAVTGPTPTGDAVTISFGDAGAPTLLAFLSSGCTSCQHFWEALGERRLPSGVQTLIVTPGSDRERPARLRELTPDGVPVVMSSQAWEDYAVPGSPYFVLVDREVRGEGAASSWHALASLVSDAIADERANGGAARARDVDATLAANGIGPDHPSLFPAGRESSD